MMKITVVMRRGMLLGNNNADDDFHACVNKATVHGKQQITSSKSHSIRVNIVKRCNT